MFSRTFALYTLLFIFCSPARAQSPGKHALKKTDASKQRELIIATKSSPPFAMKRSDGKWTGISIELWQVLAKELGLRYRFKELGLQQMLDQVKRGKVDAAVASLTITPSREAYLDFTHPFHTTGLAIGIHSARKNTILRAFRKIFTLELLELVGGLFLLLVFMGMLVWWFEHQHNHEEFGGSAIHGIGAGFWWSVVTMTTVGYGDKSPRTLGGRVVAMLWIFLSLVLVSSFTAALTSLHTVNVLESHIKSPNDLHRLKVATVPNSTSARFLENRHIQTVMYKDILSASKAVANKQAGAIVYDAPLLRYLSQHRLHGKMTVLPGHFKRQDYGIALPPGSDMRKPLNKAILKMIYSDRWQMLLKKYLGPNATQ
ncbi:MAG: ABC transporter substrate-binding protein [Deltaproteobacteria bacterium]|nr:ABC transporter substrate-binding protein [Deltaproteobacteria bacterium]MBU51665.1 ABC transporter substrate-binding protein [Deltaproteobacteria bacterium]